MLKKEYKRENRSKRISMVIKPSSYDKIKKLIEEDTIKSMSDFINCLIEDYFNKKE